MPSVIVTKIDADLRQDRDNKARATGLADYCISPENSDGDEKCVAFKALGFSEDNPDIETIKDEMLFDIDKAKNKDLELVAHWVISFKGGPEPKEEAIFEAADSLLMDLGYTEHHRRYFAIHKDTDHTHCHIVACKIEPFSGKYNKEPWWKNECQKSIARSAYKHGWQLEPGAPFVVPANPKKEKVMRYGKEVERPCVVRRGEEKDAPSVRCYAAKMEQRTGVKSGQRVLQEILREFVKAHENDFENWKCGHFHRELSKVGVMCERVKHGNSYGLTFTLDGENFESATATCPQLTYKKLLSKLSDHKWHDARDEHKEIASEARSKVNSQQLMPQEKAKVVYSKEVINEMRKIPPEKVWAAFGVEPKERNRSGKKIVNSFDICMSQGLSFSEATDFLASHFPDSLKELDLSIDVDAMLEGVKAQGVKISDENLPKAREIATAMGAMRADKVNLNVKNNSGNHLISPYYAGLTLADICRKLDLLTNDDTEIWATPVMSGNRKAIIVSEVKPGLYDRYPNPNLRLSNEQRGDEQRGEQAVYILLHNSKYDAFFDYLTEKVNSEFGNPSLTPSIQLPGLSKGVKIVSHSDIGSKELEAFAKIRYEDWYRGLDRKFPVLEKTGLYSSEKAKVPDKLNELALEELYGLLEKNYARLGGKAAYYSERLKIYSQIFVEVKRTIQLPISKQYESVEGIREFAKKTGEIERKFEGLFTYDVADKGMLETVFNGIASIVESVFKAFDKLFSFFVKETREVETRTIINERYQLTQQVTHQIEGYVAQGRKEIDICAGQITYDGLTADQAWQIDLAVARKMYANSATPDEVYSFMTEHSQQKGFAGNYFDDLCKRVAVNAAPANLLGAGSKWKAKQNEKTYRRKTTATPGIDITIDQKKPGYVRVEKPGLRQQQAGSPNLEQKNG